MSNSVIHAFFIGRALAGALGETLEDTLTNGMSELGKFDAEQRERLRQFVEQVEERAQQEAEVAMRGRTSSTYVSVSTRSSDMQASIDELRSEIARLRAELTLYRNQSV